jgi:alkylhydroperoxidase/carboxymuconolactone decarboxylase family protein YurZ
MTQRDDLNRLGKAERAAIFGAGEAALANGALGFGDLMAELVYGTIWNRPGLSRQDRMAVTLAVLCSLQNQAQLRRHVAAALKLGLTPRAIVEILIQIGIYRGFAASESALETALAVFAEAGITLEADTPRTDTLEALMERGRGLQAALHAERRHEGHAAPDNPVTGSIYPLVVQYCYGEIWDRPGLDRRLRALCAVASFAALDHDILLRKFILSALNIGASRHEIIEALIQGGPYNGFAFMLKALNIAQEAFAGLDKV